ncbi:MAG TPA: pyrroloquinoline quinone biosynthesis protein PqqE [Gemmatimonadaceae bacterium]|nr:pyrroloquinoline quinone biosynthesis protein PqqE [Gemmatimonadaceae bacterium]
MSDHRPTTLLAELTHRCPLHCPYCSNPLELVRSRTELTTEEWQRVFTEARALGVLQLGLSGGEPLLRRDLEALVAHAHALGLYQTLVTSAVGLTRERLETLAGGGLEHVQISLQAATPELAERIAGTRSWEQKLRAAGWVKALGLAFTVNVVLHRANLDQLEQILDLAAELGADRVELANTQYYGWALVNRAALLPTRDQLARAEAVVDRKREEYRGRMQLLYVLPDHYEQYPKPCYGGWGAVYLVVSPDGTVLPCHAAGTLPGLDFATVRERSLEWIWRESPGFQAFRGDSWMREPCRSCPRKHVDFGGCRCQAYALTGEAANADPVCTLSPHHGVIVAALAEGEAAAAVEAEAAAPGAESPPTYIYRAMPRAEPQSPLHSTPLG